MDRCNKLLKLHPHTVMTLRKIYNLDKPGDMDRAIDVLEEWLKRQHHLSKREYPRDFLERTIILMKGSVEKAKSQIDNLCSMRATLPKFFEYYDARHDFNQLDTIALCAIVPKLTEDHNRVYVTHVVKDAITSDTFMDAFRFGILKCEYIKAHDYCNGFVAIFDYRMVNIVKLVSAVDLITTHRFVRLLMEGYGIGINGIHIVTPSKAVEALAKILKSMLGPKVAKRIYVHAKIDSLYDYIPKNILPSDLGGYEEPMAVLTEQWKNVLGARENVDYMREMSKVVSNESHRMKDSLDLGVAGTFRSLCVD